jgi:hypothetical protein
VISLAVGHYDVPASAAVDAVAAAGADDDAVVAGAA